MCIVNDTKRREYASTIERLKLEYERECFKSEDICRAKSELQEIIDIAQCAIRNLKQCDFGGTKVLSSVTTSQKGYQDRMKFYIDYLSKCEHAKEEITSEIENFNRLINSLPQNCGYCAQCMNVIKKTEEYYGGK